MVRVIVFNFFMFSNDCKMLYLLGDASGCWDKKKLSSKSDFLTENFIWDHQLFYSAEACNYRATILLWNKNEILWYIDVLNKIFLGKDNEEFLPGYELEGFDEISQFGGSGLRTNSPEASQAGCDARLKYSLCLGWTFYANTNGNNCYLKNRYVWCGQNDSMKKNIHAISGFLCNNWSTTGDCPKFIIFQELYNLYN